MSSRSSNMSRGMEVSALRSGNRKRVDNEFWERTGWYREGSRKEGWKDQARRLGVGEGRQC